MICSGYAQGIALIVQVLAAGGARRLAVEDPSADDDAVPVGDLHVPNAVAWNLAGEPRGDDDRMLELLEPYRPQRGRVLRLILLAGRRAPARGPRRRILPMYRW